jgi:hypothetical protein
MMTSAIELFQERRFDFAYLGSCYSRNAMYKTQFAGAEFYNGVRWSSDLEELKYLIRRDQKEPRQHLLETEDYRDAFYRQDLSQIAAASPYRVKLA